MEEKKNIGWKVIERVRERDREKSHKSGRTIVISMPYPLYSGGWKYSSLTEDILESAKDAIKAIVPEELRDGKGNRYFMEDYDTFLTHAAATINDYQNWETTLRANVGLTFTLWPIFVASPEAALASLDPESVLERIIDDVEGSPEEDESSQREEPNLKNFLKISREAHRGDLGYIINYLTKREKEKLRSCLKTLSSLRQACLDRIPYMRRLDLVDQFNFLMRNHLPDNIPKNIIFSTISQLLASIGIAIKPISIYQRERRKRH